MRRRALVAAIAAAAAWPLANAATKQPNRIRRIGVLTTFAEDDPLAQHWMAAFRGGLEEAGWREGPGLQIDYRWAAGDAGRLRSFAKLLVKERPDVILAVTTPAVAALLNETRSIPIVFAEFPIPLAAALSSIWRVPAAMSPASPTSTSNRPSAANGSSSPKRPRPQSGAWR
jgi:putative ABC transport system substrate-binding protein